MTIEQVIGEGNIGRVFKAVWKSSISIISKVNYKVVAMKQFFTKELSARERDLLWLELNRLKEVPSHPNLVKILGVMTEVNLT